MQISMFDGVKPFKITKPIRLIELFAGIGAQAKALENLGVGFEHYRICEFNKYAVASYNAVHKTDFTTSDITQIHADNLGITETDKYEYIMTYSFPCTDLSAAGKQKGMGKGSGTRSGLLWEVERLLTETKELPQVLLMENVPRVIGRKNINDFAEWVAFLDKLGYHSKWGLLNAKDFGIAQNRNRCFMISVLEDCYYDFPNGERLILKLKDFMDKNIAFLSNKRLDRIDKWKSMDNPLNRVCGKLSVSPTIVARIENSASSILYCPNCNYTSNFRGGKYKKENIRFFKPKECWRLMGFADKDYYRAEKEVSNTQLYKQAGNTIVVTVLMAIFGQMFDIDWKEKINETVEEIIK